jgi:phasin family protein
MRVNEQLKDLNQANVETTLGVATVYLDSAEKLLRLQLDAVKSALEENGRNARALMETTDLQRVMTLRTKMAESSIESAMSFSRSVYEVATQTQQEITSLIQGRLSDFGKVVEGSVDEAARNAPPGAELAVTALKSTVAATTAAVDSMTRAARQVAAFAETGMKSAAVSATEHMKVAASIAKPPKK